jgi:integrase
LLRDYPETAYVFVSERKAPLYGRCGAQNHRASWTASRYREFPVHPHMLRHATGYKLANDGQDTPILSGVELMHMIRKGQMRDDGRGLSAAQQFYLLAE